jgi:putative tricarboxylic transport membrane protein
VTQDDVPAAAARALDRPVGVALLVIAAITAMAAWGYRVNFIADPVGPRAFPLLGAALIAIGAGRIVWRPATHAALPARATLARIAAAAGALAVYPLVLPTFGFIAATGALLAALAALFGARGSHGAVTGFAMAVAFYVLFTYALGVPLPIGRIFLRAG